MKLSEQHLRKQIRAFILKEIRDARFIEPDYTPCSSTLDLKGPLERDVAVGKVMDFYGFTGPYCKLISILAKASGQGGMDNENDPRNRKRSTDVTVEEEFIILSKLAAKMENNDTHFVQNLAKGAGGNDAAFELDLEALQESITNLNTRLQAGGSPSSYAEYVATEIFPGNSNDYQALDSFAQVEQNKRIYSEGYKLLKKTSMRQINSYNNANWSARFSRQFKY